MGVRGGLLSCHSHEAHGLLHVHRLHRVAQVDARVGLGLAGSEQAGGGGQAAVKGEGMAESMVLPRGRRLTRRTRLSSCRGVALMVLRPEPRPRIST